MGKFIDMTGQKFNEWTVLSFAGQDKFGKSLWTCQCNCGKIRIVAGTNLKTNTSKSCGHSNNNALKHGMIGTPTYNSWATMNNRCKNPNTNRAKYYYGKKICDRWLGKYGFQNFYKDMGVRPDGMSLHRLNNKLGYCPSNCIWANATTQSQERTNVKLSVEIVKEIRERHKNENTPQYKLAIEYNISPTHMSRVLNGQTWK